jgi:serine/threonine-protein kinase SRPK3
MSTSPNPDQIMFSSLDGPLTNELFRLPITEELEDYEEYGPGGYHPVHLGDTLGNDHRYRVVHKLGSGEFATVWLCRDVEAEKYVAVKIIMADQSYEDCPELNFMKLKGVGDEQVGGDKVAIPLGHFWIDGPNGSHLCLVLPVLGPPLPDALFSVDNYAELSRRVALQVVQGLEFLHSNGICHGGEL